MTAYYILIALIFGLAVPTCFIAPSKKKHIIYVCCCFGFMLLMMAFRYNIGNDYVNYRRYLYSVINNNMSVGQIAESYSLERGYSVLMWLTARIFPTDCAYLALNIICALLTVCPAAYTIIRYSKMPWLSAWLYVAITFLYNGMNFTRQSIAAAFVFMGYGCFVNRKHLGVLAVILLGSLFHYSVLIMIPVYIVSLFKPKPLLLGIFGGGGLLVFIFSNELLTVILSKFFKKYSQYLGTIYLARGLSPKFLIVPAVLLIIIMSAYF
ncbi:MAG: EpsG family protein, partial [Oscillospiraceae bacterium]|nr:EpsG family protein [Oscillospiraceae bacterium]